MRFKTAWKQTRIWATRKKTTSVERNLASIKFLLTSISSDTTRRRRPIARACCSRCSGARPGHAHQEHVIHLLKRPQQSGGRVAGCRHGLPRVADGRQLRAHYAVGADVAEGVHVWFACQTDVSVDGIRGFV